MGIGKAIHNFFETATYISATLLLYPALSFMQVKEDTQILRSRTEQQYDPKNRQGEILGFRLFNKFDKNHNGTLEDDEKSNLLGKTAYGSNAKGVREIRISKNSYISSLEGVVSIPESVAKVILNESEE